MKALLFSVMVLSLLGCSSGSSNDPNAKYAVDPSSLSAYKKYLEPIASNIALRESAANGNSNNGYFTALRWQNFLKYKTWYVGPVDLPKISKDVLGTSFSSDQTQQLAFQTATTIWIQQDLFSQMTERDQANLLIHEFVMGVYFLKYKSFTEFCRIANDREGFRRMIVAFMNTWIKYTRV